MSIKLMKRNKWFHVGNMEVKEKKSSYEGSGLSISIHPNEWRRIARLPGNLYSVTKENPLFLDIHKLSKKKRNEIFQWGLKKGYLTPGEVFLYEYDDEGYPATMEFLSYDEWYSEWGYEAYDEEGLELMKKSLTKEKTFFGTKELSELSGWEYELPPSLARTFCIIRYAEEVLELDGVYWNDILDVNRYSAPRAVIFQSKLEEWTIKLVQESKTFSSVAH